MLRTILTKLFFITLGCLIAAYALEAFLVPNNIIDGGIVGISIMVSHVTHTELGMWLIILNLPFMWLAFKQFGKMFLFYTAYAISMLAVFVTLIANTKHVVTQDLFLTAIFGGIILGIGVGTVLKNGGSLDGTEILSIKLNKKLPFTVGEIIMFFNIFIFICAGFVFAPDRAMYSGITYFTAYKLIDVVLQGFDESKSIFVVSDKYEEVGALIMEELQKSVTYFHAQGGYLGVEKKVIYCVISKLEIPKIKELVNSVDKNAFIAIENVHDVDGTRYRKKKA